MAFEIPRAFARPLCRDQRLRPQGSSSPADRHLLRWSKASLSERLRRVCAHLLSNESSATSSREPKQNQKNKHTHTHPLRAPFRANKHLNPWDCSAKMYPRQKPGAWMCPWQLSPTFQPLLQEKDYTICKHEETLLEAMASNLLSFPKNLGTK